jgi:hypothetical protein
MLELDKTELTFILQHRIENWSGPLWDLIRKVGYKIKFTDFGHFHESYIEFVNPLNNYTMNIDFEANGIMFLWVKFNDEMEETQIRADGDGICDVTLSSLLPYSGFDSSKLPF